MNFLNFRFPTPKTSVKGQTFSHEFVDFVDSNEIQWNEKNIAEEKKKNCKKRKTLQWNDENKNSFAVKKEKIISVSFYLSCSNNLLQHQMNGCEYLLESKRFLMIR